MQKATCRHVVTVGLLALPLAAVLVTSARADDAAKIYEKQCATCHGPGGKGDGPAAKILNPKPMDLSSPTWAKGAKDEDVAKVIKGGGAAVGKAKIMPAFPKLSDEEVQALVKLVRSFSAGK